MSVHTFILSLIFLSDCSQAHSLPIPLFPPSQREQAETMRELSQSYLDHARVEHRNVLARKQLIEARKEYIESQSRAKVWMDFIQFLWKGREEGKRHQWTLCHYNF